jgi:hypothetical protein
MSADEPDFYIVAIAPLQRLLCQEQHFSRMHFDHGSCWGIMGNDWKQGHPANRCEDVC